MEDRQKFNAILFQTINEAIAPKNDLPNGRIADLWDHPARLGVERYAFCGLKQVADKHAGGLGGIFSYEFGDGLEVVRGLESPLYFSHFRIFCFTLSWEMV